MINKKEKIHKSKVIVPKYNVSVARGETNVWEVANAFPKLIYHIIIEEINPVIKIYKHNTHIQI